MKLILEFNYKFILLLILLETLTVPFVAIFHETIIKNILYLSSIGFFIAFIVIMLFNFLLISYLKSLLSRSINIQIISLSGCVYMCMLSGFLLVIMFLTQLIIIKFTYNNYIIGFLSAFSSVTITSSVYIFFV